jgi:transcriptional regulator with XRE-family HTH domain
MWRTGNGVLVFAPDALGRPTSQEPVGKRLRRIRSERGWSLVDVQTMSGGEFKASVVGAYERGDRVLSISRLMRLAEVYGVDPSELLRSTHSVGEPIDLPALEAEEDPYDRFRAEFMLGAVTRFSTHVRSKRRAAPATELNIRQSDVATLAVVLGLEVDAVDDLLDRLGMRANVSVS